MLPTENKVFTYLLSINLKVTSFRVSFAAGYTYGNGDHGHFITVSRTPFRATQKSLSITDQCDDKLACDI